MAIHWCKAWEIKIPYLLQGWEQGAGKKSEIWLPGSKIALFRVKYGILMHFWHVFKPLPRDKKVGNPLISGTFSSLLELLIGPKAANENPEKKGENIRFFVSWKLQEINCVRPMKHTLNMLGSF